MGIWASCVRGNAQKPQAEAEFRHTKSYERHKRLDSFKNNSFAI